MPTSHQYTVFAKFKVRFGDDARELRNKASELSKKPVVFRTTGEKYTLHDLLLKNFEDGKCGRIFKVDCYEGIPDETSIPFMTGLSVQVVDGARYRRFDLTDTRSYEGSQFYMYGDHSGRAFLANVPVKGTNLDFYQVKLEEYKL